MKPYYFIIYVPVGNKESGFYVYSRPQISNIEDQINKFNNWPMYTFCDEAIEIIKLDNKQTTDYLLSKYTLENLQILIGLKKYPWHKLDVVYIKKGTRTRK